MHRTIVGLPVSWGERAGFGAARFDSSALGGALRGARGDIATWSGSYAQLRGGDLFDDDPATWGSRGWDALERAVSGFGHRLCIRSHASHVISDAVGCRRLLNQPWAERISLLYDPGSMLAPSMRDPAQIADHLRRLFEEIERFPVDRLAGVVRVSEDQTGHGALSDPGTLVRELEARHVPRTVPIFVPTVA